jgi:hypothetical protein
VQVTQEQVLFHEWKQNEVTKQFFKRLREEREVMVDSVIYKQVEEADVVIGRIQAIDQLLAIDFERIYGIE